MNPDVWAVPLPYVAAIVTALVGAIGVQYWENRKKDRDAIAATEKDFALRERELLGKAEQTAALLRTANAIDNSTASFREVGERVKALQTAHETTTRDLISAVMKRTISSQSTPAVKAEGGSK